MRNRTWYLMGLVLLAAACNSVVEPGSEVVLPGPIHEPLTPQGSLAGTGDHRPHGTIIEPPIPRDSPAWTGKAVPRTVWGRRQTVDPRRRKLDP